MKSRSKWASSLPMPQEADGCMEDMGAADGNSEEQSRHLKRGGAACSDGDMSARRMDRAGRKSGGGTKWIQGMHLKEGSFTAQAKKAGKSVHEMAEEHKGDSGKTGKRARLALTFEKMAHKK